MAATWESEWDDEEWLKQQSITTLREVYASEPPAGVDKSAINRKMPRPGLRTRPKTMRMICCHM